VQRQVASAALLVGSLLGAVLLAELVLRLWQPQAVGLNRQPLIYERDSTTGYRYRPNASGQFTRFFEFDHTVTINAKGLHDEDRRVGGGARVIAAVGDSFTAAMHVPIREGWPHLLELHLRERADPSIRVVNLGLDGTGPDVQLELLKQHVAELRPELVVLGFFMNDEADIMRRRLYREVHEGYVLQYQSEEDAGKMRALAERLRGETFRWWLFERSFLYRLGVYLRSGDHNLFRTNVMSPAEVGGRPQRRPGPSLHRILREFESLARSEGFRLVVVPVPPKALPDASLRLLRSSVSIPGLQVIDLIGAMQSLVAADGRTWQELYWKRDAHFSPEGNRVFARALADALAGSLGVAADSRPSEAAPGAADAGPTSSKRN
jgi:lysophospholipase L1-like esterase